MAATETGTRAARDVDDLYRAHAAEIYRYAYAMLGNRADAEDVVQTTFMNALRALERGEQPENASNWLVVIAHNVIRQRFRQAQARPAEVVLDTDVPVVAPDDDSPRLDDVLQALARIPTTQREALILREFEGRSYAEIAEILGTSAGALETLLFRARRSLADELDNLVTCEFAESAMLRRTDRRLSRKERRRLGEHIKTCPDCARFEVLQRRQGHALKVLALLPLPASLTLFKGMTDSAAAASLPTIGTATAGTAAAATTVGAGTGGGGFLGGVLGGGIAVKAATVAATVAVAGGIGTTVVAGRDAPPPKPATNGPAGQHAAAESAVVARRAAAAASTRAGSTKASTKAATTSKASTSATTAKHPNTGTAPGAAKTKTGSKAVGKPDTAGTNRSLRAAERTGKPTTRTSTGKPGNGASAAATSKPTGKASGASSGRTKATPPGATKKAARAEQSGPLNGKSTAATPDGDAKPEHGNKPE